MRLNRGVRLNPGNETRPENKPELGDKTEPGGIRLNQGSGGGEMRLNRESETEIERY